MNRTSTSAIVWVVVAAMVGLIALPAVSQQPRRGGTVSMALYQEPELLNPEIFTQTAAGEVA